VENQATVATRASFEWIKKREGKRGFDTKKKLQRQTFNLSSQRFEEKEYNAQAGCAERVLKSGLTERRRSVEIESIPTPNVEEGGGGGCASRSGAVEFG